MTHVFWFSAPCWKVCLPCRLQTSKRLDLAATADPLLAVNGLAGGPCRVQPRLRPARMTR